MGRTIPSFRIATVEELKEWKEFRNGLDKSDRKVFDKCMQPVIYTILHMYVRSQLYENTANIHVGRAISSSTNMLVLVLPPTSPRQSVCSFQIFLD
jgi:hypothetical protein